jgi:hypothetical protein
MLSHGQILSLEQIQQGARDASLKVTVAGEAMNLGDLMEMWLWNAPGKEPTKLECFIVGFQILTGEQVRPLPAVQISDTPYYAVVEFGAGVLCQPGHLTLEKAYELQRAYHGEAGQGPGSAEAMESDTTNPNWMGSRKGHLTMAVNNVTKSTGASDGKALEAASDTDRQTP